MANHIRTIAITLFFLAARASAGVPTPDMERFDRQVRPVLEAHCVECHGVDRQEGKFRIDTLNPDLFAGPDGEHWQDVLDQLNAGNMPPKDAKNNLGPTHRDAVTGWLQDQMKLAAEVRSGADGRTTIRRLTRYELNYTLQDLLNVGLDHTKNLPDDRAGPDGLRNNGSLLGMTPIQFEQIAEVGESAIRKALVAPQKPQKVDHHVEPEQPGKHPGPSRGRRPGSPTEHGINLGAGQEYTIAVSDPPREGRFQIRVRLGARPGPDGARPRLHVWLGFRATATSYIRQKLAEVSVAARDDSPQVVTFEGYIENVPMPFEGEQKEVPKAKPRKGKAGKASAGNGNAGQGNTGKMISHDMLIGLMAVEDDDVDDAGKATDEVEPKKKRARNVTVNGDGASGEIFIDWVEFEAPYFESWPPASRIACIGDGAAAARPSEERARVVVQSFAARAWRRPVSAAEVKPFVAAFKQRYAAKSDFDAAITEALSLVVSCPDFLYLVEPGGDRPRDLNAHELAARLSYFLWASLPDDALRQAADSGKLLDEAVLLDHVRRMLADPKARRLATHFTEQWLGVDQVLSVAVNPEYYPQFRDDTKESLEREPAEFFWYVLQHQRSATEFLDSDYVVVDETLARHYGLDGVVGPEFRRVDIAPDDHRGGLLGMACFMLAQSDGSRSHPIFRGKWVLTNVLDTPPPPPPPNVPQLNQAGPAFARLPIKEQLAMHRENQACASCHDRLDPYGVALENFDAIGQWRTQESRLIAEPAGKVAGNKKKRAAAPAFEKIAVDPSARLADGILLKGFDDLKAYLLRTKQDVFAEGLVRKLLAFSLGRSLVWSDRPEVARLKQGFVASGYKLDALIAEIILSKPFNTK